MGEAWGSNGPVPGIAGSEMGCEDASSWDLETEGAGDGLICCNRQGLISAMLSGCIHEINNPNNNILLASRLLGDYWKGSLRSCRSIRDSTRMPVVPVYRWQVSSTACRKSLR